MISSMVRPAGHGVPTIAALENAGERILPSRSLRRPLLLRCEFRLNPIKELAGDERLW